MERAAAACAWQPRGCLSPCCRLTCRWVAQPHAQAIEFEDDLRASALVALASFAMGAANNGADAAFATVHAMGLARIAQAAIDWDAGRLLP